MSESETYKELGELTKCKDRWEESIPYVASLLTSESVKIQAKALWMLGEMGLAFPEAIKSCVPAIAAFLNNEEPLLRARVLNALGRIGRGCFESIQSYWPDLFRFAHDVTPGVRLAFIWDDGDDKVRMEAPEIFRVLGKCRPDFVAPYLDELHHIAETDTNRVVRIHCQGAIRATR